MKRLLAVILAAAALWALWHFYGERLLAPDDDTETSAFTVAPAERGDLRLTVSATGVVTPLVEVEVKSKAGGEIRTFPFREGDRLRKGQIVVTLDPETEKSRVNQATADTLMAEGRLDKARIAERDARLKLKRTTRLFKNGVISRQDLDDAEIALAKAVSDVKIAEAELIRAREALSEAQKRLADTQVRSPITGTILKKFVEEGQVISSTLSSASEGTPLFTMADLDRLNVKAMVDEVDIGAVREGQEAIITVDAWPDRAFTGKVTRILPQGRVERTVTVFDVEIGVEDRDRELLKPGMTAGVEIVTEVRRGVLLAPAEAVRTKSGKTVVHVVRAGRPVAVEVETGKTDGVKTEIVKGLGEDDEVIVSGLDGDGKRRNKRKRRFFFH